MVDRILDLMQSRGLLADEADARAVVAEMRNPTEAMTVSARRLCFGFMPVDARVVWHCMIDSVLIHDA